MPNPGELARQQIDDDLMAAVGIIQDGAIPGGVGVRHWWVNQNQTYSAEVSGGFLWSPKRRSPR